MKINEMAVSSGVSNKNNFSSKDDWDFYKTENRKFITLVQDNVTSKHWKIYKTKTIYFLVSEYEEYLGKIDITPVGDEAIINTSHSTIKGLYSIMFPVILKKFDVILSGNSLSTQAIRSYEKLSKTAKNFKVKLQTVDGIKDFDKKELVKDPLTTVIITEALEEFAENNTFKKMFLENSK